MDTQDDQKVFFNGLVSKAISGDHSNFEFIKSWEMLNTVKVYYKGVKKIVKMFDALCDKLLKNYSNSIGTSSQKVSDLMAFAQFDYCKSYYVKEAEIALDMIREYHAYLKAGHMLFTLSGGIRPDEDCVDYRMLPLAWF